MTEKKIEKKADVNESDKIWSEIKDLPIDMFALPDQRVKNHVQRVKVTPTEVHLKLKSSSVVASLEAVLCRQFDLEISDGYVIVRRAAPAVGMPKPEPLEE